MEPLGETHVCKAAFCAQSLQFAVGLMILLTSSFLLGLTSAVDLGLAPSFSQLFQHLICNFGHWRQNSSLAKTRWTRLLDGTANKKAVDSRPGKITAFLWIQRVDGRESFWNLCLTIAPTWFCGQHLPPVDFSWLPDLEMFALEVLCSKVMLISHLKYLGTVWILNLALTRTV